MNGPKEYSASFQRNKQSITQNTKVERERNPFHRTFETNQPKFLIKYYHHSLNDLNYALQESNINATNILNRAGCRSLKVFDIKDSTPKQFLALLVESYEFGWQNLKSFAAHGYWFDLVKLTLQVAILIKACKSNGIILMHLGESQLVVDRDGNYMLANLDFCAETIMKKPIKTELIEIFLETFKENEEFHLLAPEVRKSKNFSDGALIWDLGILLYKAMVGKPPGVTAQENHLDFEFPLRGHKLRRQLQDLIVKCLTHDVYKRPSVTQIINAAITISNGTIPRILTAAKSNFLEEMLKKKNPSMLKDLEVIPSWLIAGVSREESTLTDFRPRHIRTSKNMPLVKQKNILFNKNERIYDNMLNSIIREAWMQPASIDKFYKQLLDSSSSLMNSDVNAIKILIILHNYIFNGSKKTLMLDSADDKKRNPMNAFLEKLLTEFASQPANLLFRYCYLIYVKFNLHLQMSHFIENNFAIPKDKFINEYASILSPKNIIQLMRYLQFLFSFFVCDRKYFYDYYYKHCMISIFREITGVVGALSNMISFVYFGLIQYEVALPNSYEEMQRKNNLVYNNKFQKQDKPQIKLDRPGLKIISDILLNAISLISQVTQGLNLYIIQSNYLGWSELLVYRKRADVETVFLNLKKRIKRTILQPNSNDPKSFTKNFINFVFRMNDYQEAEFFKGNSLIVTANRDFKRSIEPILMGFIRSKEEFMSVGKFSMFTRLEEANSWFHDNENNIKSYMSSTISRVRSSPTMKSTFNRSIAVKPLRTVKNLFIPKPRKNGRNNLTSVNKLPILKKTQPKKRKPKNKRNVKTQTNVDLESFFPGVDFSKIVPLKNLIEQRNKQDDHVDKIEEISDREIQQGKLEYGLNESHVELYGENLNDYLYREFNKGIEEWIIEFGDMEFREMIATGSTCNVYRGYYRNIEVAIKKLKTPEPTRKFRYLKEFKRELGLLIAIPNHPNIVPLYGFCLYKEEIYLVFEFCSGHTLFDILYRKETRLRLNIKQKLKVLMDICRAMQYLHEMSPQMIHRDLKTLNILIDRKIEPDSLAFTAKISDFGLTRVFEANEEFLTKRMGTFHWMAPEVFANKPYTSKSDMYGFAIIMWEIFSEKTPYYHLDDPTQVIKFVFYKGGRPDLGDCKIEKRYSNYIRKVIKRNWDNDLDNRQEFKDLYRSLQKLYFDI